MARSGEPAAKDSGAEPEPSSPLPQEHLQERESLPNSSSKCSSSSSSPPSSARVAARDVSAADAGAPPLSIDRDTSIPTLQETQQQPGSYDSGRSTALSYFAPTGAGKISFFPPSGVHSQTDFRIHRFLGPSSRESLRYYTTGGGCTAEQSAPWRTAPAVETMPQREEPGLIYASPPPGPCGVAVNSSASTRVSSPTAIRREPAQPPILPASFVQSSRGTFIPQQRLLASGGRIGAADAWGQAGPTAVDSPRLQQYGQIAQVDGQRKQVAGTGIFSTFFVGTPRQSQYYMEPRAYADMKLPQFYTAAPRSLNEKTCTTAAVMEHGLENMPPSWMQLSMQREIFPGSSANMRQGKQWGEQPPVLRISRGVRNGETRRRKRMPWECCVELMSPQDFFPMLSASQARLSRSLRANIHTRRTDISRVLQRFQGAVRHYYQQLTRNVGVDGSCGGRCPPEDAQQISGGSQLWRRVAGERYISPRFVDKTSHHYAATQQPTASQAGDLMKGREAMQMLWKDGRALYGPSGVAPELMYTETSDQRNTEALETADQSLGKPLLQLPHRELSAVIPQSSSKGVDGTYYTGTASTSRTRACPTCGASQGLVYVDKAPFQEEKSTKKYDEGALQRLAHGDLDGCLQRLGEWRCTLCSDVAAAADDEVLHTGGVVQQGGEWVDQMVELLIHGVAETMRGLFLMIPRPSQHVVEGYPLYEPDYTYLTRKGRPTSLTGNFCVDQINAFLDACLVDEGEVSAVLPKAPPVPETTCTGHWLIDAANAALDKLCAQAPPPSPPSKAFCPPIETLLPPCCRDTPLLPPRPPPRQTTVCPCLGFFKSTSRGPALECPHCHQQLRSGVCPVESPRERRFKRLFEDCLSQNRKASVPPSPTPLYAYESPPVGYYVPSTAKQPATGYYTPVYGTSPSTVAVEKQTNERIYYTPCAATADPQGKPSDWAEPAALVSSSGKADVCQYPYAPVYSIQPCSKGFTVSTEEPVFLQPRA